MVFNTLVDLNKLAGETPSFYIISNYKFRYTYRPTREVLSIHVNTALVKGKMKMLSE